MNLFLKISFVFLFVHISYANDVIKLPKHFKTENTFSGDLSATNSFHLVFSKNKKNKMYSVHSFLFDGENVIKLTPFENKKSYSLLSFHKKNDVLSLLLTYKIKKDNYLQRVDINTTTKEITKKEPALHKDFVTVIRDDNRSIVIYKSDEDFSIFQYNGTDNVLKSTLKLDKENKAYDDFFEGKKIDAVKTNEFVANGSTLNSRVYLDNSDLIFTKENTKDNYTEVVKVSLNDKELKRSEIKKYDNKREGKAYKKFTSFYQNNKIFQFGNDKKEANIKIYNTNNSNNTDIKIDDSLVSKIKGNDSFSGIESFLKQAGKNKHNTTITVNPTKNNKLKVRVDYVDITYSYHYNWWWHHHQFMMWQQQNMIMNNVRSSIPSGFGPRQPNDLYFNSYIIKKEKRYFELLLNTNNEILNEELPDNIYKEIDKKEFIDKLENMKDIKHESSCFLKNSYRYIGYSKKLKGFIIQTNKI